MEWQVLINIVAIIMSIVGGIIGWWVRFIQNNQKEMLNDLRKLEVILPTDYVRKDEIKNRFDRIELLLDKVYEKLENKVDK